ncbi:hypothetical protein LTR70_006537 [Exophiala xenobiotica]|uniref:C2H2-type domain-containing protein n=1 Tax=Lithohypha guttulata TaxID=1690604 RepID=A0ABR0K926_9EURO|nr:hypothetical protein LTR24_006021 [Lithohypha guttulata]KAK5315895.1 hypothetical protein LTR70_006537 [Exophiala xenobiotica]
MEDDDVISRSAIDNDAVDGGEDGKAPRSSALHKSERECYMCLETVVIWRKRDWQLHVLDDLEPYQCIESYCPHPNTTYGRLSDLRDHYARVHPSAPIMTSSSWTCIFCTDGLAGKERDKFRHVARHMEEMAFSIVPRQYEQWDFYADAGSREGYLNGSQVWDIAHARG